MPFSVCYFLKNLYGAICEFEKPTFLGESGEGSGEGSEPSFQPVPSDPTMAPKPATKKPKKEEKGENSGALIYDVFSIFYALFSTLLTVSINYRRTIIK